MLRGMFRRTRAALFSGGPARAVSYGSVTDKTRIPVGAPTRGLGRFFHRTRALLAFEPMYWPHGIWWGNPASRWARSPFEAYDCFVFIMAFMVFCAPALNAMHFYQNRSPWPWRVPTPVGYNLVTDIDDPDWRMKREMTAIEKQQGPRPYGYNRYLDHMKGIKVSDPAFKPYIPSEHGEGVGAHAGEIIAAERVRHAQAWALANKRYDRTREEVGWKGRGAEEVVDNTQEQRKPGVSAGPYQGHLLGGGHGNSSGSRFGG